MSTTISVDELSGAIENELTLYSQEIIDTMKKQAKTSMDKLVRETKATAPVGHRRKHYRDSIKSRKEVETNTSITYVWYVDGKDYRLSHLLENGHALRNGGRYSGTQFIAKALDPIMDEYLEKIEEVCRGGS